MEEEIDSILENMFLLVVTAFPDEMGKYKSVDFSVLENKLRDLLPKFPDIKVPNFTMLKQATMILNGNEVDEVYRLLAKGLKEQQLQVETPEELSGDGMAYPVRIYSAFDMRDTSLEDKKRLFGELGEGSVSQIAVSIGKRIEGHELKSWEDILKCKTSDINCFFEYRSSALNS